MSVKDAWNDLPSPIRGFATGVSLVAGVIAVITGFAGAIDALDAAGFPIPATRSWVRQDNGHIKDLVASLNSRQRDIQIDNLNGKIESAVASRNKIELDALKYDDEGKVKARQEMARLDETIGALQEQKRAILGIKGPR